MVADQNLKPLRRTITPYVGQAVIFAGITLFIAYVATKTSQWDFLWTIPMLWALFFFAFVNFGMRYRVFQYDAGIVMSASGGPQRRIQYEEITEVRTDLGGVREQMGRSRPFRRIVVMGRERHPGSSIDISLRHFLPQDIDGLLNEIRAHRPDLDVPTVPWGSGSL